jgi:hypothetical protein
MDKQSLWRLGAWLQRRYVDALTHISQAKDELCCLGVSLDQLDDVAHEWGIAKEYHQAQVPSMHVPL